jgi:hypothetical protein
MRSIAMTTPSETTLRRLVRLYLPLVLFVVPTTIIGFGVLIPRSCINGINELTIGFGSTVFFSIVTYVLGVRAALKS